MLVEKDRSTIDLLERWLERALNQTFVTFQSDIHAETFLRETNGNVRCVILGGEEGLERLLGIIDSQYPSVCVIVSVKDSKYAEKIQKEFPRVTVVRRGEGIEELLTVLDMTAEESQRAFG